MISVIWMFSWVIFATLASSESRVRRSSSRCVMRLLTVFSWFTERPAPCSTRWLRLLISSFRLWIVSFALCSFSCEASTIFQARSISLLRFWIVDWSSLDRLRAICTLLALDTISAFSSRHFFMRRFSLSCDFFSARCSFSYSMRKCSRDLSPISSCSTTWKSFSSASKALDSKASEASAPLSAMAAAGADEAGPPAARRPRRGCLPGRWRRRPRPPDTRGVGLL
mmetsp:Transcript_87590/g.231805  ORF Transcript_87590/g.231805 Transcript_87590/m.231805 type:complete len:225 (-) Transcript_87590:33-707(-)